MAGKVDADFVTNIANSLWKTDMRCEKALTTRFTIRKSCYIFCSMKHFVLQHASNLLFRELFILNVVWVHFLASKTLRC